MTIATAINRSGPYTGNGVTTVFAYDFKIEDRSHVQVIRATALNIETVLVIDTDYTVTGVGDEGGGNVVLNAPLAAGLTVTMLLNVPFTQETDLENQGAYYAETVEAAFDLAAQRDLQLMERMNRAVLLPASSGEAGGALAAELAANIKRLAQSADEIDAVSGIDAEVVTVAGIADDVALLADVSGVLAGTASAVRMDEMIGVGDGVKTSWTLPRAPGVDENVLWWVNGAIQDTTDYSVSGVTLTHSPAVANGVEVRALVMTLVTANDVEQMRDATAVAASTASAAAAAAAASAASANGIGVSIAVWPSGRTQTMIERSKRIAHSDDFNIDMTGVNVSQTEIARMFNQANTARVPFVMAAGTPSIDDTIGTFDGLTGEGNGNSFFRANPFSFFTEDEVLDPRATTIVMVGTGPKRFNVPRVTSSKQCGYDRQATDSLIARDYNNAYDSEYVMFDGTNEDGVGATPATLKQMSAAIRFGSDDQVSRVVRLRNIQFALNCPGAGDGAVGIRGYGRQDAILPWADWDMGIIGHSMSMSHFEDVNIIGPYRERGMLLSPAARSSSTMGQGEHFTWRGGYCQGGLAIRGGDDWPIIAKTTGTLSVMWTKSHTFASTGTLKLTTGEEFNYGGLTYDGATTPPTLRFTSLGGTSTATVKLNESAIQTTANAGVSHTEIEGVYLADQGYSTRLEGPNNLFSNIGGVDRRTRFRAAFEASGEPCRAVILRRCTPMALRTMFHLGRAQNFKFEHVYSEVKTWKANLATNGAENGALFIAGPKQSFKDVLHQDFGAWLTMVGDDMTGGVSMYPEYEPSGRFGAAKDGQGNIIRPAAIDIFNPVFGPNEYKDEGRQSSAERNNNRSYYTQQGRSHEFFNRIAGGTVKRLLAMFASGNVVIGETGSAITRNNSGNVTIDKDLTVSGVTDFVVPEYTVSQISNAANAVNTTGKRRGKVIMDENFRRLTASAATPTATWRDSSGAVAITPS